MACCSVRHCFCIVCIVLQCAAACCSVLQRAAAFYSVLQCAAACCSKRPAHCGVRREEAPQSRCKALAMLSAVCSTVSSYSPVPQIPCPADCCVCCAFAYKNAHLCTFIYICIYVCVCIYVCAYIYIHVYTPCSRYLILAQPPRGGGLGSRPKKMYGERLGDGVEYHLMSPTPRR